MKPDLIIPTRRVDEDMLQRCIESFKNQYNNLIIVDELWDNLSKKINYGVTQATSDYVCVTNDDVTLMVGNISDLCDGGLTSPAIMEGTTKEFHAHCWVMPRDKFWKVGGMDEGYDGWYYDDSGWWMECLLHQVPVSVKNNVIVSHPNPATTLRTMQQKDRTKNNKSRFIELYGNRGLDITQSW
jgi:glycosyltransferase involved in cell wall biosynthesis